MDEASHISIGLAYSTPREKLDRFVDGLRKVYEAQPRADTSELYVGLKGFGPSSLDIELWGYVRVYAYRAQVDAQHALIGDIVDWAKKVGVSFAFSTHTVHVFQEQLPVEPHPTPQPLRQRGLFCARLALSEQVCA